MKRSKPVAEHLEELDEAIKRKDYDFHYDPGDHQFSILVDYE
jgi:iron uptake system EfeUOB component EfeO/EfeM